MSYTPSPIMTDPTRPDARPRGRPALNLLLLVASFYTMTLAGAMAEAARLLPEDRAGAWLGSPHYLALGLPYSLCLIAILGAHEMGHYLACRRYGVDASLPYFLPSFPIPFGTFGAFIRIHSPFPSRNVLFDVGVAGPLAGFIVALPVLAYGVATAQPIRLPTGEPYYSSDDPLILVLAVRCLGAVIPEGYSLYLSGPLMAGWVGCLATAINLFPVGQLDGGHICYAISSRFHRQASVAGIAAFVALGLLVSPNWLFFATVLLVFGPRHPPVLVEDEALSPARRVIALIAFLILIACFIPRPLSLTEPEPPAGLAPARTTG